jgi:hypothetical protein
MKILPWFAFSPLGLLASICLAAETPSIPPPAEESPPPANTQENTKDADITQKDVPAFIAKVYRQKDQDPATFLLGSKTMLIRALGFSENPETHYIFGVSADYNAAALCCVIASNDRVKVPESTLSALTVETAMLQKKCQNEAQKTALKLLLVTSLGMQNELNKEP